jgi:hypothetical protein
MIPQSSKVHVPGSREPENIELYVKNIAFPPKYLMNITYSNLLYMLEYLAKSIFLQGIIFVTGSRNKAMKT